MQTVLTLQATARSFHGKRPFAGILIGPDHTTLLLSHTSLSHVEHAEASLARLAAKHYSQHYLWQCTMYSTWEPCAMCAATCYWANIGRVVFGASNETLFKVTGEKNRENFGMRWGCEEVIKGGQKEVDILGPLDGWEGKVVEDADLYWKPAREEMGI